MIILDSSETHSGSTMPVIQSASTSVDLERLTGADVLISSLEVPCTTETLLRIHLKSRCILIQVKRMGDLLSSIVDKRINLAIAKMREWTDAPWQRVIMSTGIFVPNLREGHTLIGKPVLQNERTLVPLHSPEPVLPYRAYATIRRRIAMRGAAYLPLTGNEELVIELLAMERDFLYLKDKSIKDLFISDEEFPPDPPLDDDPLQQVRIVRDGRRILAAFDGIGPVKATSMWNTIKEWNQENRPLERGFTPQSWEPTTMQLLTWACMSKERRKLVGLPKVSGWGEGMYGKVREQLGLGEGEDVRVEVAPA